MLRTFLNIFITQETPLLSGWCQTVDKVGVGIYSQHHFSLYNQYFDSFLKI